MPARARTEICSGFAVYKSAHRRRAAHVHSTAGGHHLPEEIVHCFEHRKKIWGSVKFNMVGSIRFHATHPRLYRTRMRRRVVYDS
jgi:hypothetical protein